MDKLSSEAPSSEASSFEGVGGVGLVGIGGLWICARGRPRREDFGDYSCTGILKPIGYKSQARNFPLCPICVGYYTRRKLHCLSPQPAEQLENQ